MHYHNVVTPAKVSIARGISPPEPKAPFCVVRKKVYLQHSSRIPSDHITNTETMFCLLQLDEFCCTRYMRCVISYLFCCKCPKLLHTYVQTIAKIIASSICFPSNFRASFSSIPAYRNEIYKFQVNFDKKTRIFSPFLRSNNNFCCSCRTFLLPVLSAMLHGGVRCPSVSRLLGISIASSQRVRTLLYTDRQVWESLVLSYSYTYS